jgi:pSer/pThr/pTyr-binding forkhead associated (FHA) protein
MLALAGSQHGCGGLTLADGSYLVGRSRRCQLVVRDKTVSRQHAQITVCKSQVTITDLDSVNGTWVDGVRVHSAVLSEGLTVKFGAVRFLVANLDQPFEEVDSATATRPTPNGVSDVAALKINGSLTPTEKRVCTLLLQGLAEKEVASRLRVSEHTIHNHVRNIYRTFDVHSHPELMAFLLRGKSD